MNKIEFGSRSKNYMKRRKRQAADLEEIFEKHVTDNAPGRRMYEELLIFNIKKAK